MSTRSASAASCWTATKSRSTWNTCRSPTQLGNERQASHAVSGFRGRRGGSAQHCGSGVDRGRAANSTGGAVVFGQRREKTLPPFQVKTATTLVWRNGGDIFQIFPKGLGGGSVNSQAHAGATYLPPGSYRLSVNAIGSWTIRIVAGVERPVAMGGGRVGFRGDGGRALPPFNTRHGGPLSWSTSGDIFQIFPKDFDGGGDVNSEAHRGTTFLDAGTHELSVNAMGSWTISWKP
jgi:hypothetical protein